MSSDYSAWIWSPEHNRHYCWRYDANGNVEYQWSGPPAAPQVTAQTQAQTPRTTEAASPPATTSYNPSQPSPSLSNYTHLSQPTARPSVPADVQALVGNRPRRHIKTGNDNNDTERLDPGYRRVSSHHHARFFCRGRVFKMLWTEPAGQMNPGRTRGSTHFSVVRFSETAYSEIRRFVIVQNKGTFSQCIPIQTYRGQGATKPGVLVEDHAVIFTGPAGTDPPPLLEGENITKQALRVNSAGEELDPTSRINFGKPYAVEHNVKVMEIGQIASEHVHLLWSYFQHATSGA